jgi:hypothetical protein
MRATQHDRRQAAGNDARREGGNDLDRKYGRIGISAVAAAARYCSGAKTSPPATEARRPRMRHEDETAT